MSAVQRAKQLNTYTPTQSIGGLTCINIKYILKQKSLQNLQQLCYFCERMKINPTWYEKQSIENKIKFLQIYQYSIKYSNHLKKIYDGKQQQLIKKNQSLKNEIKRKKQQIRYHKDKVDVIKEQCRSHKLNKVKHIYEQFENRLEKLKVQQFKLQQVRMKFQQDIESKRVEMIIGQQVNHQMFNNQNNPNFNNYQGNPMNNQNNFMEEQPYSARVPPEQSTLPQYILQNNPIPNNTPVPPTQNPLDMMRGNFGNNLKNFLGSNPSSNNVSLKSSTNQPQQQPSQKLIDDFNRSDEQQIDKDRKSSINKISGVKSNSKVKRKSSQKMLDQDNQQENSKKKLKDNLKKLQETQKSNVSENYDKVGSLIHSKGNNTNKNNNMSPQSSDLTFKPSPSKMGSSYINSQDSIFHHHLGAESKIDERQRLLNSRDGDGQPTPELFKLIADRRANESDPIKESLKDSYSSFGGTHQTIAQNDRKQLAISKGQIDLSRKHLLDSGNGNNFSQDQSKGAFTGVGLVRRQKQLNSSQLLKTQKQLLIESNQGLNVKKQQQMLRSLTTDLNIPEVRQFDQDEYMELKETSKISKKTSSPKNNPNLRQTNPLSIKQVQQDQENDSYKIIDKKNSSSMLPPALPREEQQQYELDYQDDLDFGLNQQSNIDHNTLKVKTLEDRSGDQSNLNIEMSSNQSFTDAIKEGSPFIGLKNQIFELKPEYKVINTLKNSNFSQESINKSEYSQFGSLHEVSKLGYRDSQQVNSVSNDFLDDLDMPMDSMIGKKPNRVSFHLTESQQKNQLKQDQEMQIRVVTNSGNVINSQNIIYSKDGKDSELGTSNTSFLKMQLLQSADSAKPHHKIQKQNIHLTSSITQSNTFNSNGSKQIVHGNDINKSTESLQFQPINDTLKSKQPKVIQKIQEQPNYDEQDSQRQQLKPLDEEIELSSDTSKNRQFERQQLQRQMVRLIRNKQKLPDQFRGKSDLVQVNKIIDDQVLAKLSIKDIGQVKDWRQVQQIFRKQITKVQQKRVEIEGQLQKVEEKVSQKDKNKQIKQRQDDLNYSTSTLKPSALISGFSRNPSNMIHDSFSELDQRSAVDISHPKHSLAQSIYVELPQNSKFVRHPLKLQDNPSRDNNLMGPSQPLAQVIQTTTPTSKSKYAIKTSKQQIPPESIISKIKQSKYNLQDQLQNDISKASGIFRNEKKSIKLQQDDF